MSTHNKGGDMVSLPQSTSPGACHTDAVVSGILTIPSQSEGEEGGSRRTSQKGTAEKIRNDLQC